MTLTPSGGPRYRIVETLGRGGMGEVCLADDVMLDRPVALKFVTASGGSDGLEQLLGEARAAAALDHPFICSIYEVTSLHGRIGEFERRGAYLVGWVLADIAMDEIGVREVHRKSTPVPLAKLPVTLAPRFIAVSLGLDISEPESGFGC